ncbi:hypothetical protein [Metabacillus sp. Hm71]|uniref:SLAC1 family transporter n=1 Tax=Metabacillus sp. Hm71 TaxID=3450743 RepID=UPI003F41DC53
MKQMKSPKHLLFSHIEASSGSIIMAIGIFLVGAIQQFSVLNKTLGNYCTYLIILIWFLLLVTFFRSILKPDYRHSLMENPITFFGAGTWIASTSVIGNLAIHRFPGSLHSVEMIFLLNLIMWSVFIAISIHQFRRIIINGCISHTHGVLLLSTVSTQSMASLMSNLHSQIIPNVLIDTFIFIGIAFYLFCFLLLFKRFFDNYTNIHEWKNTDCIIHGAVSITGLSMTVSGHFSVSILTFVWYTAFTLFLIVESFELIRGFMRIKTYGVVKGIFTYHQSQWSRNFTFGMFYLFTKRFLDNYSSFHYPFVFQHQLITPLGWVVLILLVIQVSLFTYSKLEIMQNQDVSTTSHM